MTPKAVPTLEAWLDLNFRLLLLLLISLDPRNHSLIDLVRYREGGPTLLVLGVVPQEKVILQVDYVFDWLTPIKLEDPNHSCEDPLVASRDGDLKVKLLLLERDVVRDKFLDDCPKLRKIG